MHVISSHLLCHRVYYSKKHSLVPRPPLTAFFAAVEKRVLMCVFPRLRKKLRGEASVRHYKKRAQQISFLFFSFLFSALCHDNCQQPSACNYTIADGLPPCRRICRHSSPSPGSGCWDPCLRSAAVRDVGQTGCPPADSHPHTIHHLCAGQ